MELRKQQEEAEKAKEAKEMANKKEKMRLMKEQVPILFLQKMIFLSFDFSIILTFFFVTYVEAE